LSDPALTAVAVSMFSAPATSIVNQLFAAVEKIPLLCFFQPFSQLGHSYFQISLHSFCCASGTRWQEDLWGFLCCFSIFKRLCTSAVLFFAVLETSSKLIAVCLLGSTSGSGIFVLLLSRSDKRFLVISSPNHAVFHQPR